MLTLFIDVLGPVILIVGLGALSGAALDISVQSLSRLAYWILGPAFVFDIFANSHLGGDVAIRLVLAGIAGMLAAGAVTWTLGRSVRWSTPTERAADVLTSMYGNVGNTGLAVTVFALGDDALGAAGVLMLTINVLGMMIGISLASAQDTSLPSAAAKALLAPMTVAAAIAIPISATSASIPAVFDRGIGLLSGGLIPVLLFTLGIQLRMSSHWFPTVGLGISTLSKLVVAPMAAVGIGSLLGLSGDNLGAVAIQSAMPPAVFCLIVANEHDLEPERVTTNVAAITLLSLITLPVVLVLFAT